MLYLFIKKIYSDMSPKKGQPSLEILKTKYSHKILFVMQNNILYIVGYKISKEFIPI